MQWSQSKRHSLQRGAESLTRCNIIHPTAWKKYRYLKVGLEGKREGGRGKGIRLRLRHAYE